MQSALHESAALATTAVGGPLWQHCSDVKDCYNCTTAITGCHWCPDGTCSAYGTLHCLVGQTCASPSDCIRSSPEFHGYGTPPAKAVLLFLFIAGLFIAAFVACLWACFKVWDRKRAKELKQRVEGRRRQEAREEAAGAEASSRADPRGIQLSSLPVSAAFRGNMRDGPPTAQPKVTIKTTRKKSNVAAPGLSESLLDEGKVDSSGEEMPARYAVTLNADGSARVVHASDADSASPSSAKTSALSFPPPLPPLTRKKQLLRSGAKWCTVMASLGVIICLIVACLMFPHMPGYSVCNKDIQWGSILRNMVNFSLTVDVDLHLSLWNPNRFSLLMSAIDARILYKQDIVGVGSVHNVSFSAGSIDDFILTVAFSPSLSSASSMYRDHLRGSLLLDVLFDLDTSVLLSQFAQPVFHINTSYVFEHIDAEGVIEREFCKCQNPDVTATAGGGKSVVQRIGARFQQRPVLQIADVRATARLIHARDEIKALPTEDATALSEPLASESDADPGREPAP